MRTFLVGQLWALPKAAARLGSWRLLDWMARPAVGHIKKAVVARLLGLAGVAAAQAGTAKIKNITK